MLNLDLCLCAGIRTCRTDLKSPQINKSLINSHTESINLQPLKSSSSSIKMRFEYALAAFVALADAAVVHTFSDGNCQNFIGETNVYDNSCSHQPGFSSYIIIAGPWSQQDLTTYSNGDCAGPQTSCNDAASVNVCYPAWDSAGASNAIGSGAACGFV